MKQLSISAILVLLMSVLTACNKSDSSASSAAGGETKAAATKSVEFVTTQDGKPLVIDPALFDTAAAKEFLTTGKNPYIGNQEAIAKGKKTFQYIHAHNVMGLKQKVK